MPYLVVGGIIILVALGLWVKSIFPSVPDVDELKKELRQEVRVLENRLEAKKEENEKLRQMLESVDQDDQGTRLRSLFR